MPKSTYFLFTFTAMLILWQCASIQSPSGGEKDLEAPVVVKSFPEQEETNTTPRVVKIEFDEYVKLNNLQKELLISPPLSKQPVMELKGKKLQLELEEEELNPNTTYTFNFGKGIADYHEGNILENYTLVFSTGDELDSLFIKGRVNSCHSATVGEQIIVGVYQKEVDDRDSTLFLQKPDYFGLIKEDGTFRIDHIRAGTFELCAFEDVNGNYQYDGSSEQIAFYKNLVNSTDTGNFDLWLFKEEAELKLLDTRAKENGRIHFAYNALIDSAEVYSSTDLIYKTELDSVFVWALDFPEDSFKLFSKVNEHVDSAMVQLDSLQKQNIKLSVREKYLREKNTLHVHANAPILTIDTSQISVVLDSVQIEYAVEFNHFELFINFEQQAEQTYTLILNDGAVLSTYENTNDSTNISFYTKKRSALAALKVNLETDETDYFIELLKDRKIVCRIDAQSDLKFSKILPDSYQLRITLDSDKNGKWSPGNYLENIQPEKVFYYTGEIKLRANWEFEIDWLI